jgi:hypothetical protein
LRLIISLKVRKCKTGGLIDVAHQHVPMRRVGGQRKAEEGGAGQQNPGLPGKGGAGLWPLDAGCWMLDAGCWMLIRAKS